MVIDGNKHQDLIIMLMALADAYLEKGLYVEAAKKYNQLLAFRVANREIYTKFSKALIGLKKFDSLALEIYQKAIQYDPNNAEIYNLVANTFLNEGREDPQAIEVYEKTLSMETPLFEKLAKYLAPLYFKKNEFNKCKELTEQLLTRTGYQPKPLIFYLKSTWKAGRYTDAIILLKKLIDVTENNTVLLKHLCYTYLEMKFEGEVKERNLTFSYVDHQLTHDYIDRIAHFDKLQDIVFYLELKRFLLEDEYWGSFIRQIAEERTRALVLENREGSAHQSSQQTQPHTDFHINNEILNKLNMYGGFARRAEAHSHLTFEDFQEQGAEIFAEPEAAHAGGKITSSAEILITAELTNFEFLRVNYGMEHIKQIRNKLLVILSEIIEAYQIDQIWGTANGFLIFNNDIIKSVSVSIDILNKLNRYNYICDEKEQTHLAIGIHHSREGLNENNVQSLRDLSTGIKVGIVTENDLALADRPIYSKVFQKTDRIFLSGKAYREIKSSNRFKTISIGQFKLKYLKEKITLHEVAWRNPIDDLKFGFINKLGRFDLLSEIGSKGAIKVYKAKDSVLQRFVILKIIQSEVFNSLPADNAQKLEFYRLAKSLGQMNHQNIANLYEVDEDQGLTYIAREYIEGTVFSSIFERGKPVNMERIIKIIYEIFKGLQYSHRMGFYHLNLKPHNIMVGSNDEIKIMDFLIPSTLFDDYKDLSQESEQYYLAPEQIRSQKVDARTDIFAMGVILYEIVTQIHPFDSKDKGELENAILNKQPHPASELNKKVPKFLDALILKCMAKEPENRIQNVEQIVTLLKTNFERLLFSNFNYQIAQSRDAV